MTTDSSGPTKGLLLQRKVILSGALVIFLFFLTPSVSAYSFVQGGVVPITGWVIIIAISILFFITGILTSNRWLAYIALGLFFISGYIVQDGNLGLPSKTITNATTDIYETTIEYQGWSGSNNHFVGYTMMVSSIILFSLILLGGGSNDDE